jgi:hypothetical protein
MLHGEGAACASPADVVLMKYDVFMCNVDRLSYPSALRPGPRIPYLHLVCDSRVCSVTSVRGLSGLWSSGVQATIGPNCTISLFRVFAGGRDPGSVPRSRTQGYPDLNNGSHGAISRL